MLVFQLHTCCGLKQNNSSVTKPQRNRSSTNELFVFCFLLLFRVSAFRP